LNGHIKMSPDAPSPGLLAEYYPRRNEIRLSQGTLATREPRQAAVHECTHAAFDLMKLKPSRGLHRTENEGMANIAERLYIRYVFGLRGTAPVLRYERIADRIAERIIANPQNSVVSPEEMRRLRNAVGQDTPEYRGKLTVSDG
jgi:hypothetical protein